MPTSLAPVVEAISAFRYRFANEDELQQGIDRALRAHLADACVIREHHLGRADRPDFFLRDLGIAVEVKVAGSRMEVVRQLQRYALHDEVRGVVLVTTRTCHEMPADLCGKPVAVVRPSRGVL